MSICSSSIPTRVGTSDRNSEFIPVVGTSARRTFVNGVVLLLVVVAELRHPLGKDGEDMSVRESASQDEAATFRSQKKGGNALLLDAMVETQMLVERLCDAHKVFHRQAMLGKGTVRQLEKLLEGCTDCWREESGVSVDCAARSAACPHSTKKD